MNDKSFELLSMPASREPVSLQAVDRAVSELRRGCSVAVRGAGGIAEQAIGSTQRDAIGGARAHDTQMRVAGPPQILQGGLQARVDQLDHGCPLKRTAWPGCSNAGVSR